jgi:hypothetical protein
MCDYSLHNVRSRKAVEGEPLQVHAFPTGSLGLASPTDLQPRVKETPGRGLSGLLQRIKNWFEAEPPVPAVCVPPGARLVLREIPAALRQNLKIGAEEEVTFIKLKPTHPGYCDAVRLNNGQEILLQRLPKGLRLDVLSFSDSDAEELGPLSAAPREMAELRR